VKAFLTDDPKRNQIVLSRKRSLEGDTYHACTPSEGTHVTLMRRLLVDREESTTYKEVS
jgi:hypothetical protein